MKISTTISRTLISSFDYAENVMKSAEQCTIYTQEHLDSLYIDGILLVSIGTLSLQFNLRLS